MRTTGNGLRRVGGRRLRRRRHWSGRRGHQEHGRRRRRVLRGGGGGGGGGAGGAGGAVTTAVGAVVAASVPALSSLDHGREARADVARGDRVLRGLGVIDLRARVARRRAAAPRALDARGRCPVHVAATVRTEPTTGPPTIAGPEVNAGFASAPAIAGSHSSAADARAATMARAPARLRTKAPKKDPPTW